VSDLYNIILHIFSSDFCWEQPVVTVMGLPRFCCCLDIHKSAVPLGTACG